MREIGLHGDAVAPDRACPFGPGDRVRAAIGRIGRVHHAHHGAALAEEGNRDRRATPAGGVFEGAVVRIDQPDPAGARAGRDGAFLAAELRRDQRLQQRLQPLLDFTVERAAAAAAARSLRGIELGAQPLAFRLDGGDDSAEGFGGRHTGSVELLFL